MFNSFLKFTFWFFVIVLLGLGALSLTSYAAPYINAVKALVLGAFE